MIKAPIANRRQRGAAFGAGFAAVTSGIEAFKNLNEFDEFG